MVWVVILIAGLFEVAMAYSLKLSNGFSVLLPSIGFLVFGAISFGLLALGLKTLEVGTAYAVWTGVGAVGTAVLGIVALGENASALKIASILLIVAGVVGLNIAGGGH
ncbi:multidrug efflux SMR transporter [Streptosporangium sp. NBC_01755]|uniref:DMT family transporter n=1 Tax=unclassified Streptosporangium TaxID=2632669 RepID=UPI002DD82AD3|nr:MULTISPECIES: multidrug efflux SMR transporter [unclassified Streptosporangium]WSA25736.1 multidrug efflux SMR transporter [Streptosporangium sp. NBC_01810]WSD02874.1 multidrug efflux SMR transporter [Streptosporangium sp. NBC_01755]